MVCLQHSNPLACLSLQRLMLTSWSRFCIFINFVISLIGSLSSYCHGGVETAQGSCCYLPRASDLLWQRIKINFWTWEPLFGIFYSTAWRNWNEPPFSKTSAWGGSTLQRFFASKSSWKCELFRSITGPHNCRVSLTLVGFLESPSSLLKSDQLSSLRHCTA